jgi:hypothetical protein
MERGDQQRGEWKREGWGKTDANREQKKGGTQGPRGSLVWVGEERYTTQDLKERGLEGTETAVGIHKICINEIIKLPIHNAPNQQACYRDACCSEAQFAFAQENSPDLPHLQRENPSLHRGVEEEEASTPVLASEGGSCW